MILQGRHQVLPSPHPFLPPPPPPPSPLPSPPELPLSALDSNYSPDALSWLRTMLGDSKATFRSPAQYHVYKMLLERKKHVVSIASTGSGKTLPFQLLAKTWSGDIRLLMVLPYQVLHTEMK